MWRRPWAEINPIPEISLEGNALSFHASCTSHALSGNDGALPSNQTSSPHLTTRSSLKHLLCRRFVAFCKSCDIAREHNLATAIATLRAKFDDPIRQANDIEIMLDD